MRGGPVYVVKPKYIFKHPFNKYDLANPSNRETQNEQLTDYFNYGFNEDTMNIYGKLVKRFIEVLDPSKSEEYFKDPSELMRLNDQMPMDFGGFNRFHDPWLIDNEISAEDDFHNGESLMKFFVMMILTTSSKKKLEYPLIEFVKQMYTTNEEEQTMGASLVTILEQIGKNLEVKYQATMEKLKQKIQEPKTYGKGDHRNDFKKNRDRDRDRERERQKPQEQPRSESHKNKHQEKSSRHHSSDDSDSASSQENSSDKRKKSKRSHSERDSKTKKKDKKRSRDRSKDRDRHRKEKKDKDRDHDRDKDKHKSKKVKKEKSSKRSYSRDKDRKKKHH